MPPINILTNEETFQILQDRIRGGKPDSFRVKIFRKDKIGSLPEQVALFEGATLEHLASPETWLPKFAGGGPIYRLDVYGSEQSENAIAIGGPLTFNIQGEPKKPVDWRILFERGWSGPATLIFPDPEDLKRAPINNGPIIPPASGSILGFGTPQTPVPAGMGQGQVYSQPQANPELARIELERASVEQARRELEATRQQMIIDQLRAENERQIREVRDEVRRTVEHTRAPPAPPPPSLMEQLTPLLAAITPIITPLIAAQNETRRIMLEQQQKQAEENNRLLRAMLEKKTEDGPQMKFMAQVGEVMGSVMGMMKDAMEQTSELVHGPKESTAMLVTREISKAVAAVASASTPPQKFVPRPRALPGGKAPTQVGAPPQPVPQAAQPQAQRQTSIPPPPVPSPGAVQIPPMPTAAEEIAVNRPSVIAQIEQMVRANVDPATVAAAFINGVQAHDSDLEAALHQAQGNPVAIFQARLGDWVRESPDRVQYVQQLMAELNQQGADAGLMGEEDAEYTEGDEEEEDAA